MTQYLIKMRITDEANPSRSIIRREFTVHAASDGEAIEHAEKMLKGMIELSVDRLTPLPVDVKVFDPTPRTESVLEQLGHPVCGVAHTDGSVCGLSPGHTVPHGCFFFRSAKPEVDPQVYLKTTGGYLCGLKCGNGEACGLPLGHASDHKPYPKLEVKSKWPPQANKPKVNPVFHHTDRMCGLVCDGGICGLNLGHEGDHESIKEEL